MRLPTTGLRLAIATSALGVLAACGGPEDDFKEAINTAFAEHEKCWNIDRAITENDFPISVGRSMMLLGDRDPILVALESKGYVELEETTSGFSKGDKITLTKAGLDADVWVPGKGFCVGVPKVVEIVRYTYADNGANENAASVDITYQYEDMPSWVDRSAFPDLLGMAEPDTATIPVQKSSDGWHASIYMM